tara:strand:- start:222 stop:335 length:114 start_codon:yes stop_codon:yes gene_type:complete
MNNYWDSEYPTHIEVPENYWVYSYTNVEYSSKENSND